MSPMLLACLPALLLASCDGPANGAAGGDAAAPAQAAPAAAASRRPFAVQELAQFDEPWAMTFLPDGRALVTEKKGRLILWRAGGRASPVAGVPKVDYGGQGGFGDVVLHPDFARNRLVYLSWVESGGGDTRGAVVGRARLAGEGEAARLEGLQVIWRQQPKVTGRGHYAHRLAFARDGHLFITSGDRQKFDPAQDMGANLGKVLRLTESGEVPRDNPFAGRGGVAAQIWSLGHRNPLGIAFDGSGQLWTHEMGPAGGDEFNRIEKGSNYGYPIVSNGDHYDGKDIPDHSTRPEFNAPEITWTPVISPGGLIIYSGPLFPQWRGNALIAGLSGKALVRVEISGAAAREAERWDMGQRIREVEQGPDGAVYLLEDEDEGAGGRLLKLVPAR
ncbi:MAG TPA: PQQ-dependent sugar dehydrogenase [Allosphingosinicella sp.]|nr:PQQ-dependent sugar dehydrogenase [Allosphingosinicella sp.]